MKITLLGSCFILMACGSMLNHAQHEEAPLIARASAELDGFSPGARVALHGQIFFGAEAGRLFVSHIPMAHPSHDVQAILEVGGVEVSCPLPRCVPTSGFHDVQDADSFRPAEPWSLDSLVLGELTAEDGLVFAGNFEATGAEQRLPETATLVGIKTVYARALMHGTSHTMASRYLLFAGRYLVRQIQAVDETDEIVLFSPAIDAPDATLIDLTSESLGGALPVGETITVLGTSVRIDSRVSLLKGPHFTP